MITSRPVPRLITAILCRNEAGPDRYLHRVLARCAEFSDALLVLDDGSTDDTVKVAESFPTALVKRRPSVGGWWGQSEGPARMELWERGVKLAQGGWMLICDADMLLMGDPRPYCESWDLGAWAWPLADCWDSEDAMRIDGPWQYGAITPRPWLFHVGALPTDWSPVWQEKALHVGHFPPNLPLLAGVAPDLWWKHLAYLSKEHRVKKSAQYLQHADQLTEFERMHAATIAD